MDEPNSLIIEVLGIKATALGTLPVLGLLAVTAIALIVGPGQILLWIKRLRKSTEE